MKNFEYAQEQKLIKDIFKIHDEIFSMPAKRYIFYFIDEIMMGTSFFAYVYADDVINKQIIFLDTKQFNNFDFHFGDKLIVIYTNKLEKCKTTVKLINNPIYEDLPNHISIICQTDFLHYRQFIQTYRDCFEFYKFKDNHNDVHVTQLTSFEYIVMKQGE